MESDGWADFSLLTASIRHSVDIGLLSELDWTLGTGYFIENQAMHFSDYQHFKSYPLYIDMADFEDALMLLDYYEASTADHWIYANAVFNTSYLLIKFLPWFSERLWNESIGVSYLYTPQIAHYMQLGYSLNEIFFMADIGVYVAFQDWGYKGFGARLNFRF
jgi:hypothetical protein